MKLFRPYIVIAGSFGAGKTEGVLDVHSFLKSLGQEYEPTVSDATYILEALDVDHLQNHGMNHMHKGHRKPKYHDHAPDEKDLQFAVTGNFVPLYMYTRFFQKLSQEIPTDKFQVVEWSGGRNVHWFWHPAARADYSYRTQIRNLRDGIYENEWLQHVALLIHPITSFKQRLEYNNRRMGRNPTDQELADGSRSWGIPLVGMKLTGRDDLSDVIPDLERMGLKGRIVEIPNNGDGRYKEELSEILGYALDPIIREGRINGEGSGSSTTNRGWR